MKAKRQKNIPEHKTLEKLFAIKEKGKVQGHDIVITATNKILVGSDTTGVSLSAIIYYLLKYPPAMKKLRKEIQRARDAGNVSTPIIFKEAQELPYLQAVIKECLRLHPEIGFTFLRVVPGEGTTIYGQYFPPGITVGVNPWVINRNINGFGPDTNEFKPERWLESKERTNEMDHYFTSSSGARGGIGRNISHLENYKIIPELVTRFDWELEKPEKEWKLKNEFFVIPEFKCFVKERKA